MAARSAEIAVVIVNWNGGELVRRAVESVVQAPPRLPFEIVVVDNASTDQSLAWLRARAGAGDLRLIENDVNTGFSRANNRAIAETRAELILLLNPDAEVTPGAIDVLIETLQSHPRNGACGPRLTHPDGTLQPSAWRNPPTAWATVVAGTGIWRLIPRRVRGPLLLGGHWDHATRRSVPMLFGAALLVKRAVIADVGALDERFHMYAEDNEWCLRMTRGGWRVVFEPAATVIHHGAHSARQRWTDPEKHRVQMQANLEFQRHALTRMGFLRSVLAGCAVSALQRGWRAIRRAPAQEVATAFHAYSTALKEAVRSPRRATVARRS